MVRICGVGVGEGEGVFCGCAAKMISCLPGPAMWPHDSYFRTWLRLTLPPLFRAPPPESFFRSNIPKIALVLDMTLLDHRDFSSFFCLFSTQVPVANARHLFTFQNDLTGGWIRKGQLRYPPF